MLKARILIPTLLAAALGAQEPQPPAAPPPPLVLKATTRLVQVSVIVHDGKNQPVSDLKKDDFQLKVNGNVQTIKVFSVDSRTSLPNNPEPLPPHIFTNRLESNAGVPSAVTVLLIDLRNTGFADQVYAKAQAVKYLRTLEPGDHIGLYVLGGALRVLHDYTTDSTDLLKRLADLKDGTLPNIAGKEPPDAMHGDAMLLDTLVRGLGAVSGAERDFYTTDRVLSTLRALEFIANHMARVPGRKNLIWVSGGFPLDIGFDNMAAFRDPSREMRSFADEIDRTVRAINDANMAIYPVDARGLMVGRIADASVRGPTTPVRGKAAPAAAGKMVGVRNQETMRELADRTGGRAFVNTNDLTGAIRTAVDDSRVTYTLGFYPSETKFDGKFHKIDVQLPERHGLKLRYRKGFFDLPEQVQDEKLRKAELADASWSPLESTAIGIAARVELSKTKLGSIDILVKVDHTSIELQPQGDRWAGRLDFLFVQRDDRTGQSSTIGDTMDLNLKEANYQKLQKEDLIYGKTVERAPRARLLRVVVRDAATGSVGSVTIPMTKVN
jgi:VWFA-related protein